MGKVQKKKRMQFNKYHWYLLFFLPLLVGVFIQLDKENDIFFLLKHGEYVIKHGFPITDFLSMHQDFSFVMQQWLSAVIFYLFYYFFGNYGLVLIANIINILILYMLYKYCMLISNQNAKISILITCLIDLLLESMFIMLRPQIFDYLILILVLYIMEIYYQKKSSKVLLFLPLLSLLQINLHSSTWFLLFLFMLPYVVSLGYEKIIKHQDKRLYQVLGIMVIMVLVGFLNPYGVKNITYLFHSYGSKYINEIVLEMYPPKLNMEAGIFGFLTFLIMGCVLAIYIDYKKEKISLRYALLLLGVSVLALTHVRNLSLYIIGAIAPLALFLKDFFEKEEKEMSDSFKRRYKIVVSLLGVFLLILSITCTDKLTSNLEKGVDYLLENYKVEDIVLYANYNNGSYLEFRGLKPYIDARAEVFLKQNNKKENIMKEFYLLANDHLDYKKFVDKYQFTHFILSKKETLYYYISNDKEYTRIYRGEDYEIYEKKIK